MSKAGATASAEDIVEFTVLRARQERRHLRARVHERRAGGEPRVAHRDLTVRQRCHFDTVAHSAAVARLAPLGAGEPIGRDAVLESLSHGPTSRCGKIFRGYASA